MTIRNWLFRLCIIALLLLSACDDSQGVVDSIGGNPYEVDISFREFYQLLGGRDTLGPPISPFFLVGEIKYQYTVSSLMVSDPTVPANQRFQLGALGSDMGIEEAQVLRPDQPGIRYVNGHVIPEMFVAMYERLGGARYVGKPLTEMHFNADKQRYEQYFENLGMYWLEGSTSEDVRLLAFGAWKCDNYCRNVNDGQSRVSLPSRVDERFASTVKRLGADFTGFAITDAYPTPDGFIEQVYENMVLVSTSKKPRRVFLRHISERLGILPEQLVEPNGLAGFTFYKVQGELGYNVPQKFMDYLAFHGGLEISGAPIGEMFNLKDGVYRQCFENLCIEEHISEAGVVILRPSPLGYTYRQLAVVAVETPGPQQQAPAKKQPEKQNQPETQQAAPVAEAAPPDSSPDPAMPAPGARELGVQVYEVHAMVSPNQSQVIGVGVFENNTPMLNIEPDIIVVMPDGRERTYYMYPTDADGQTRLQLEPIDAPNGTIIPYQVCIYNLSGSKFCVKDSFLIWSNP